MTRKNRRPCRLAARARKAAERARLARWNAIHNGDDVVLPPAEWDEHRDVRADLKRAFEDIMAIAGIPTTTIVKTQAHVTPRMFHRITGRYAGPGPEPARMTDGGGVEYIADLSPGDPRGISWIAP